MKVYGFFYTDCIHEGGYMLQSLHETPSGAYKAMKEFLGKLYDEWRNSSRWHCRRFKFGYMDAWTIECIEVQP